MKNVLIIPPFNPYPLISGGHQAIYNGIAILEGVANVYVYISSTESEHKRGADKQLEKVLPFVHVLSDVFPVSHHTFRWYCSVLWNKLKNFDNSQKKEIIVIADERPEPETILSEIGDISEHKVQFILKAIKKYNIDIVQVEMMPDIKIVDYLPHDIETIFVQHEIKYIRDELLIKNMSGTTKELLERFQRNKREEIELHNKYDKVVTLSPTDSQKLIEAGVTTTIVTSLAVVNPSVGIENSKQKVTKTLSYVGPESHYPNYDAIMWFLDNCWLKLQEKDSDYTLQIIGLWTDSTSSKLAEMYHNKVKCLGFVSDLANVLDGTTMIVPINIGSGIRMKILEAAQLNVPVVTTPVGCEGLPIQNGVNGFITNDADEFVEDIIKLQDAKLRNEFIANLREIIANKYSLEALKKSRIAIYKEEQ